MASKQFDKMFKYAALVLLVCAVSDAALISRATWGARAAKSISRFSGLIPYVVVHHSVTPQCSTLDSCRVQMRNMQNQHMDSNGWADIGYSFAVGGDGNVYEGRGWNVVGAHAPGYNSNSVGILMIGDFRTVLPSATMINAAKSFISSGVSSGKITSTYKLIGHRQALATECPGERLFQEIKTWPRWTASP